MGVPDLYLLDSLLHCSVEALIEANSGSGDGVNRCLLYFSGHGWEGPPPAYTGSARHAVVKDVYRHLWHRGGASLHGIKLAGLLCIPCSTPTSALCYAVLLYNYLIYLLYLTL